MGRASCRGERTVDRRSRAAHLLAAEAAIAVVWLVTIASGVSGDWPSQCRWIMSLTVTSMIVSRRLRVTRPRLSDSLVRLTGPVVFLLRRWT